MGANVDLLICETITRLDMIVNTVWMRSDWSIDDSIRFQEAIILCGYLNCVNKFIEAMHTTTIAILNNVIPAASRGSSIAVSSSNSPFLE